MKKSLFYLLFLIIQSMAPEIFAQVGIGNGIIIPNSSAILEVKSANRGMLIPRMSETEINLIQNPANGLQVFCTTDNKIYVYITAEHRWKNLAYGNGELVLPATYAAGTGGICNNIAIHGTYMINVALLSLKQHHAGSRCRHSGHLVGLHRYT